VSEEVRTLAIEERTQMTKLPGHGLSGPQMLPSSSGPDPFASHVKEVKSAFGGMSPGLVDSGKIHSVTGWTYCPAIIWPPFVGLVPPEAVIW
jgi:hypothetical protein